MVHNRFSVKHLYLFHLIIKCGFTERYKNDLGKQRLSYSYFSAINDKRCTEGHGGKSRVVRDQKTV